MLGLLDVRNNQAINDMDVDVTFSSVLPQNEKRIIEMLSIARGGEATMSAATAVKHNPLVTNSASEMKALHEESGEDKVDQGRGEN